MCSVSFSAYCETPSHSPHSKHLANYILSCLEETLKRHKGALPSTEFIASTLCSSVPSPAALCRQMDLSSKDPNIRVHHSEARASHQANVLAAPVGTCMSHSDSSAMREYLRGATTKARRAYVVEMLQCKLTPERQTTMSRDALQALVRHNGPSKKHAEHNLLQIEVPPNK